MDKSLVRKCAPIVWLSVPTALCTHCTHEWFHIMIWSWTAYAFKSLHQDARVFTFFTSFIFPFILIFLRLFIQEILLPLLRCVDLRWPQIQWRNCPGDSPGLSKMLYLCAQMAQAHDICMATPLEAEVWSLMIYVQRQSQDECSGSHIANGRDMFTWILHRA